MTEPEPTNDRAGGLAEADFHSLLVVALGMAMGLHAMIMMILLLVAFLTSQPYANGVETFYEGLVQLSQEAFR